MALTESTMLPLGRAASNFSLPGVDGKNYSLADFSSAKALLVVFMCNHCPYVVAIREKLVTLYQHYKSQGLEMIGISSNDADSHPEDSFPMMKEYAQSYQYDFPYLYDESQGVAHAYSAACTPDFFLFDQDKKLVYRGRLLSPDPDTIRGMGFLEAIEEAPLDFSSGKDLIGAINAVLIGKEVSVDQKPSMGCNIKWK